MKRLYSMNGKKYYFLLHYDRHCLFLMQGGAMEEHLVNEKMKLLRMVDLFANLGDDELEVVARNSSFSAFRKGTVVFGVGQTSLHLYVVFDGEVLITRHLDSGDVAIAQYNDGDFFGELDLFENAPRDATAITMRDSVLLMFPMDGLPVGDIFIRYPRISAQILFKLLVMISTRLRDTHRLIREKTPWVENLKKELFTDKLTGLFNSKFLLDEFKLRLPRYGPSTSLLMIKPDNFKKLNDLFGHESGDRALLLMSVFIQSSMDLPDIAIRYHGDEFAAVLPGKGRNEAISVALDIGRTLYDIDFSGLVGKADFQMTLSIGIAVFPVQADNSQELVRLAHERMITARSKGGNRIIAPQ